MQNTISADYYYDESRPADRRKTDRRVYEVQQMTDLHHEITRRLLCGQKVKSVAESLGCTPQTVSNVKNSKVVKEKLDIIADRINKDFALIENKSDRKAFAERAKQTICPAALFQMLDGKIKDSKEFLLKTKTEKLLEIMS